MIGRDSFLCGKEEIDIPGSLLEFLHRKGIFFWDGLINKWNGPFSHLVRGFLFEYADGHCFIMGPY